MTTLTQILKVIDEHHAARVERAIELDATIDNRGRLHASHDGYTLDGVVYQGGEYLPEEDGGLSPSTLKIKCSVNVAEILESVLDASHGKTWEHNGFILCYCYIRGMGSLLKKIKRVLPNGEKQLVLAGTKPASECGKSFKFSYGKVWAKAARDHNGTLFDVTMEPYINVPTYTKEVSEKGIKKTKFKSEWDGKACCFWYPPDYITE